MNTACHHLVVRGENVRAGRMAVDVGLVFLDTEGPKQFFVCLDGSHVIQGNTSDLKCTT